MLFYHGHFDFHRAVSLPRAAGEGFVVARNRKWTRFIQSVGHMISLCLTYALLQHVECVSACLCVHVHSYLCVLVCVRMILLACARGRVCECVCANSRNQPIPNTQSNRGEKK